ncbi:hypothetical protein XBFFL1_2160035 [Xenorhabdus bovienii str. feltiae Florida]|uniref:Uncharacterized protein n=2 Tax=Xenorhabdus bovienii TaxID=40576 RepID=A0A0B6XER5_XENBV|nr:hypothetical protein XBFFR1_260002 [Xenorhabdus bovienii str. feltiae France]CDG92357.1 hypothetical protein XBFFL1_2160035 [Xenorhabdus bovienii str. feltiae Florida]CDG99759.1 hypothetical protein XBFM1_1190019 [Xenorhabdus bovienii str. feltiae Moldova]CDM91656.1 protein of unknown function [Xenorhabdus bovienii]
MLLGSFLYIFLKRVDCRSHPDFFEIQSDDFVYLALLQFNVKGILYVKGLKDEYGLSFILYVIPPFLMR